MNETAHLLDSDAVLVGVVTHPACEDAAVSMGVVLFNAGAVHRVGPNRLYVALARRLAALGFPVLRLDLSGIGDSPVREDRLPLLESRVAEAIDGMNHLQSLVGCTRFVLIGLCSGAEVSLRGAAADERVIGVALINARRYGMDDAAFARVQRRARARHYLRMSLRSSFTVHIGKRLLKRGVGWKNLTRAIVSLVPRPGGSRYIGKGLDVINGLLQRGAEVYCIHSEADEGLDHFHVLRDSAGDSLRSQEGFRMEMIAGADHTFTLRWSQEELLQRITRWMQTTFGTNGSRNAGRS